MSTSLPNKKGIHQSMMKCIAVETGFSTVKALISDHLWNSEKWSQLELAAHEKELLFKGPRDFLPLSTSTHGALVNILKNWTFSYRDNTFLTILDWLRSVFHESKILVRTIAYHEDEDKDIITGCRQKTRYGRPEWEGVFSSIARSHPRTNIGVFFCGPAVLSHQLHKVANKHSDDVEGVKFFYNKESF